MRTAEFTSERDGRTRAERKGAHAFEMEMRRIRQFARKPGFKPVSRRFPRLAGKGALNRHILIDKHVDGYDHMFHATKGWRRRRVYGEG